MSTLLFNKTRGAGVKDWSEIKINGVNLNNTAMYTLNYGSYSSFTGAGTTLGLPVGKVYTGIGNINWTSSYNQSNTTNVDRATRPLVLTAQTNQLNANVNVVYDINNIYTFTAETSNIANIINIRFYIGPGTTNYYNVNFTFASANKQTRYMFKLVNGIYGQATVGTNIDLGAAVVSMVGVIPTTNPVITRIDTISSTQTAATTLTPIQLKILNNVFQEVGAVIQETICCFDEVSLEIEDETNDILCKGKRESVDLVGRNITMTVQIQKISPVMFMFGSTNTIKITTKEFSEYLSGFSDTDTNNKFANIAGVTQVTVGSGLNLASVELDDCVVLMPVSNNIGSANLDVNTYHYNSTTGVLTVNNAHDNKTVKVKQYITKPVNEIDLYAGDGYAKTAVDVIRKGSKTNNTMIGYDFKQVQWQMPKLSVEDEGDLYEVTGVVDTSKAGLARMYFL